MLHKLYFFQLNNLRNSNLLIESKATIIVIFFSFLHLSYPKN